VNRLQRLARSVSDPRDLLDALHRLPEPIPAGQALDLALPPGAVVPDPSTPAVDGMPPKPWALVGAMTVSRDSAVPGQPHEPW
jgi:hypothetical protein